MAPESSASLVTGQPWLSIIGIGEDGLAGLGAGARRAIETAELVFGGKRHIELAQDAIRGEARTWPQPFDRAMQAVLALRGQSVCVLASGDPFYFGVGVTLARHLARHEYRVYPHPSAFSLAAARLGWALQEVETVSLHGRPIDLIRPLLHPGRRILALTSDAEGPAQLASLLTESGFSASRITVLEALGGERQRERSTLASAFDMTGIDPLNLVAIEVETGPDARLLPLGFGLPDELFEHDGQITKREIRAATLSALSPLRGEILWDIGAGSGSIAIEWMLAHPSMRAIAIEHQSERAARIRRNARRFGVPSLDLIEGKAPQALAGLPQPDAIFIGGGGSGEGVLPAALEALKPGGRLVANAVTLEMERVLLDAHEERGGRLTRLAIDRAEPVGRMTGWRPAMPVTQWIFHKPEDEGR
ncbi:precorrin-6y C5,15-methyltransferase (decarboxylating) subunit CbiE [Rhizobium sp. SSA_523]|uniref:precorrin-6y C5,15-methyltransferase (decarboxylating) subunit CbiE n=1 Tax=Rhizobium sp. SSA_523 TaxID=2952477 RepID=UPI0020912ACF|nr:precorrin-6y C5,15-methyltransferase (decarboxylating) subunit CbiE [Rhizobium sp. SSA_523]MCO5734508.1 precorrin-6y C5,15-methyltransferase (decarboxylating) subunit CbiE [Rhizobium sp. SSA_523]WKC23247.1 precorrin-6y C5,15-methyltransferase (decarboxylating) subunit CbiE [Rhizobium sp. SSA_523]